MKKTIVLVAGIIAMYLTSCGVQHTCPTYIGATGPHQSHIQHHPHH